MGLLYGGLQITVAFSPLVTVKFEGCWTKVQFISAKTVAMSPHTYICGVCISCERKEPIKSESKTRTPFTSFYISTGGIIYI